MLIKRQLLSQEKKKTFSEIAHCLGCHPLINYTNDETRHLRIGVAIQ